MNAILMELAGDSEPEAEDDTEDMPGWLCPQCGFCTNTHYDKDSELICMQDS